jgi:hypothetical protein
VTLAAVFCFSLTVHGDALHFTLVSACVIIPLIRSLLFSLALVARRAVSACGLAQCVAYRRGGTTALEENPQIGLNSNVLSCGRMRHVNPPQEPCSVLIVRRLNQNSQDQQPRDPRPVVV